MTPLIYRLHASFKAHSDRIAYVDRGGERTTTYRQLDILSGKIAAGLLEKGCKKGDIIPVLMPRCTEYIASEIAIMKIGGLFAPLIMDYPKDRVDYIMENSGARMLVDLAFVEACQDKEPVTQLPELTDGDGGYVIYTSGSTGKPKGILHDQRSLAAYVVRQQKIEDYRPEDIRLSVVSHSFSVSIPDNYVALSVGSTVHMLTDEERKDIRLVEDYILRHRITVTYISPSQLKVFRNKSDSLRLVTAAGERLVGQYSPDYQILNFYGTSETGTTMSFMTDRKYENTPIGRPCHDIKAYILDDTLAHVPDGEEGELCLAGPIARGYIGLPEQTAKAFVPNPYSQSGEDTVLYRTNDMVKRLPDGNVVYVNRKDWMVKINGQRVETGEIEVRMSQIEGVDAAVVKAFVNEHGQNYLVAYFKGGDISAETIKAHLRTQLPDYMIPLFFQNLEAFPLNASGKLDRLSLTPPDISQNKAVYAPPENETQKLLCTAYEQILGCGRVGIDDDFYELGGDSIKTMMLQNACQFDGLSTEIIYEGRTPRAIAEALAQVGEDLIAQCLDTKLPVYPLTSSQMGIYLACQSDPQGTMYNTPCCYTFEKDLGIDIGKLRLAVEAAVRNHESLAFRVDIDQGIPVMRPREISVDVPVIMTCEAELEQAKRDLVRPFDLSRDLLFRFAILETEKRYCFVMDLHHIAFDGTSVSVLCREISQIYGGGVLEPEILGQFGLSVYEQKLMQTDRYQDAKRYFESVFAGVEAAQRIDGDMQEDPAQTDKPCRRFHMFLSDDLSAERVGVFTKSNGITENTLFLGAFQYAMAKFVGQNEVVICAVDHGRHDGRMKDTVGMMVRTLPLHCKFEEELPVADFLGKVQTDLRETIRHDCCPFVDLAAGYGLSADVIFAYQSDAFNSFRLGTHILDMERIEVSSALAALSVMMFKKHGGYEIEIEYRTDLYEEQTIRSFAGMYVTVIREMMHRSRLCQLRLVDDKAQRQIRQINRRSETDQDLDKGFLELFREQVARTPDKVALVYREERYTYRELDRLTDKIGAYLIRQGFGPGDFVPVLVDRCAYMTICSIGVLKSGAAYEPLDPTHPSERIGFMIGDAKAGILIANEALLSLVPEFRGQVLRTEEIPGLPECDQTLPLPKPDDPFVLLYTSGSTGVPKGCAMEHRNITNFVHHIRRIFQISEESATAAYASYGFDAHMMDIYPYLAFGATEHIIPEAYRLDLMWINDYCRKNGITNLFMTTQVGRAFVTSIEDIAVKIVGTGGEKLVPLDPPEGVMLYNMYGPTECTVVATTFLMDKYYDPIPIGTAVDNAHLYVVDKQLRMLPVGAVGELCVAGPLVSRGYLDRPDQTQKAFVPNPFEDGERYRTLYRTGDIVRFLNDGNVGYVGRRDGMVKIRGYRIELTEVEGAIREFPGIKDATVVAQDLPTGGKCIVAYVVADEPVDMDALKASIREKKPYYMIPEGIMQLDAIPLNVNSKVDRRKLPPVERMVTEEKTAVSHRPLNRLERTLTDIIAKIISVDADAIDLSADLMHTGMTSLSVIKLAVQIKKVFGFDADIKRLMKGSSVLSLEADIIDHLLDKPADVQTAPTVQRERVPLSYTQYGVYTECMKDPDNTFYNIPFSYRFPASFDAQALAKAVEKVLLAHPYLFTRLVIEADDVMQERQNVTGWPVPVRRMDEEALARYRDDFLRPFPLMGTQLFRIEVVQTERGVYLLSDFHHIVFDGASFDLYMDEVRIAYEGGEVEPERYSYFDHVADEIESRNSEAFRAAQDTVARMLSHCDAADEITPDLGGLPENGKAQLVSVPFDMDPIASFCAEQGVTPAHLFLAATLYVVSRATNSRDAYINTISNGRSDLRLRNSFGMFVKTLPIGMQIGDVTALELVRQARSLLLDAIDSESYPYAEVCRRFGYAPNILYAYQLGVADDFTVQGHTIEKELIGERRVKFKTGIYIEKNGGQDHVDIVYNDAQYSRELMLTLAKAIVVVAGKLVADPMQRVRGISLMDGQDAALVEAFSQTAMVPAQKRLFHELFEQQVALHPDRTAVIACDGHCSYEALDHRANRIANALIRRGIRRGSRVVLLLERDSNYFAAMFGVLKAGGAFIPSCPDHPKDRIESIIHDSAAELVITYGAHRTQFRDTVDIRELLQETDHRKPAVVIAPEDLAYLIYTSGSTGRPKGVMLRHEGIANYVTDHEANLQVRYITQNCTCYGSVTTVAFDMSLKETAVTLCNGLTLAFANDAQTLDAVALTKFLAECKIDAFNATPSRLLVYMEVPGFAEVMKNCKVILSGGEKYPHKLLRLLRQHTDARILNTYGPTEITVSSNAKDLTHTDQISIGRPLLNYKEYVVDLDDNKLPAGIVGELLIGGVGVAAGYNGLPEQTEKAFIQYDGQRFYRSGDHARWTPEGDVIILGRKDDQVKIRGLRIELGEIENRLSSIEGVHSAAIVIRKLGKEDGICAYFTAERTMDIAELKAEMKKSLTEYMIPSYFEQLDMLPLTANGKLDMKALAQPTIAESGSRTIEKPVTAAERVFCRIFREILELDEVSATDSFFDLGGTSLTVTRVVIAAGKEGYDISFGDVFSDPTPRRLARLVGSEGEEVGFEGLDDYDYTAIDRLLKENTMERFREGQPTKIGDVILAGATGFLGVHVLHELLENYDGMVWCPMRGKHGMSPLGRMRAMYFYYFDEDILTRFGDRVTVVDGDITDPASFEKLTCRADTFINCAANVKHFSKGTDIEDVNFHGVQNILSYCESTGTRLIQVSTMSVGGVFLDRPGDVTHLKEQQLYFGQTLTSKYTNAKFLAERDVLEAAARGMDVKIMRVGTLAPRELDGEYQINFTTNTFMGRLKATYLVGCYPYETMDMPFELSPIDHTAKAILLLAQTPKGCTVFHPFNNHTLIMNDLYRQMDAMGLPVRAVEADQYAQAVEKTKEDPEKAKVLSSMIAYQNMAHGRKTFAVEKSNAYTMQVLYRMGFRWPVTSLDYMKRFLEALEGLGYFDET